MLLLAKIIGGFCTVIIPAGICGVQAFLTKTQQEHQKQKIESELQKTKDTLAQAKTNYDKEITRIKDEKNALATIKTELTYKPIAIQDKIQELTSTKQRYESHHTTVQAQITEAIKKHSAAITNAQTTIENLWKAEKARVEAITSDLDTKINNAKDANKQLISSIDTTKASIEETINDVFYTPVH